MGAAAAPRRRRPAFAWPLACALLALALVATWLILPGHAHSGGGMVQSYTALTFRGDFVQNARFAMGGRAVIYSTARNGQRMQLYFQPAGSDTARPLNLDGTLAAVSSTGSLAMLQQCHPRGFDICQGTLATASLSGGAPRAVMNDVTYADFDPAGQGLAVIHVQYPLEQVEYPIGHVLYQTADTLTNLRFSPDGRYLALQDNFPETDIGSLRVIAVATGANRTLGGQFESEEGLTWAPDSKSVWVAAGRQADSDTVYAIPLHGQPKVELRLPPWVQLFDRGPDQTLLLSVESFRARMRIHTAAGERGMSWLSFSLLSQFSSDGRKVLFCECFEGENGHTELRAVAGGPALDLGAGAPVALSPDGQEAVSYQLHADGSEDLWLLPEGAGQARALPSGGLRHFSPMPGGWIPDTQDIVFVARQAGKPWRMYRQSVSGGAPRAISPPLTINDGEGLVSPDGRWVTAQATNRQWELVPAAGGTPRPLPMIPFNGFPLGWARDAHGVFFISDVSVPQPIHFASLTGGGADTVVGQLKPDDMTGVFRIISAAVAPDGKAWGYSYYQISSHLLLVKLR
ncbi:MAG: hypothetical protein ACRD1Y_05665, partial [Terriglobales bacterium]